MKTTTSSALLFCSTLPGPWVRVRHNDKILRGRFEEDQQNHGMVNIVVQQRLFFFCWQTVHSYMLQYIPAINRPSTEMVKRYSQP